MTLLTVWFMPCALARRVSALPVIRIGRLHRLPRVWCPTGRCLLNSLCFALCGRFFGDLKGKNEGSIDGRA